MDNIEKIRRKIKELQDEFISIQPKDCSLKLIKSYAGYAYLDKVLSFLDTLESEKPMQEGLEEEIERCVIEPYYDLDGVAVKGATAYITVNDVADIARHFAEWGAEHLKK